MNSYNGFSPSKRSSVWNVQKKAIKEGTLVQQPCEMCGQDKGLLMPHLEDYDAPLTGAHWLCVECHISLHGRFKNPVRWVKLLLKLREGYKSPPYYNVMAFFSKSGWDKDPMPEFVPDINKWHERLPMTEPDFQKLSEEEKEAIR